jgi:hypothetical protein
MHWLLAWQALSAFLPHARAKASCSIDKTTILKQEPTRVIALTKPLDCCMAGFE